MMGLGQMPTQFAPQGMPGMLHPAVLAHLQRMGLFGMRPQPQGLGYPGVQPLSPASVGSLR